MKLPTNYIELIGLIVICILIFAVIVLFIKVFKKQGIKLKILGNEIETNRSECLPVDAIKKMALYDKIGKLYKWKESEIIRRQMDYADIKGIDIINYIISTYQKELFDLPDTVEITRVEDYKNFQLLQWTFYYDMKRTIKTYFIDNGFDKYLLCNDTYKNIDINQRFEDYKMSRINQVFEMAKTHSNRLYTGRYISTDEIDIIIADKCGQHIAELMNDIFENARKVYIDVYYEISQLEKEIKELETT